MIVLSRRRFLALSGPALAAVLVAKPRKPRTLAGAGYGYDYGMNYGG